MENQLVGRSLGIEFFGLTEDLGTQTIEIGVCAHDGCFGRYSWLEKISWN